MQGKLLSILNGIYSLLGIIICAIATLSVSAETNTTLLKFQELLHLLTDNSWLLYLLTIGLLIQCALSFSLALLSLKK
ncbi:hypothetical protein D5R81_15130 [Parashewanella spongiae]|uniref:Uncharacterized protein n=1 Tax=Parashewanella spongiae TaxID=342950 RepID=A0A3A6TRF3_9GAMM|nr:hypothetical protein D5R81_15130 [Parashewanella spongiae]